MPPHSPPYFVEGGECAADWFNSFHRGSNVSTIPGTGLGMSIVKQCVDLHGGKITVNSEVGVGTTFIVTLPLNQQILADKKDAGDAEMIISPRWSA